MVSSKDFLCCSSCAAMLSACDPGSWPSGAMLFASQGKYVEHATDFRAVLGETLERHLLLPTAQIDAIVPGWSGFGGPTFQALGFLA